MKDKAYIFKELLSDTDFSVIQTNNFKDELKHPVIYLLQDESDVVESSGYIGCSRENTKCAIGHLYDEHFDWLKKIKKKLLDKDRVNVSAALGEIRCFGYLAETFGSKNVSSITETTNPTPDLMVRIDNKIVQVEVNTVQINEKEANGLREYNKKKEPSKKIIKNSEHVYHPYGLKPGASITQSVILKMISIKESNHQLNGNLPSILWVDLQDEYMNPLSNRVDKSGPYFSGNGYGGVEGIISNELWYSVYSKINDPVFEGETLNSDEGNSVKIKKNIFSGKFMCKKYNNLSAVVFYGPNGVVIYENPKAKRKLPECFIEKFSSGRWFKIESSRINFPNKHLKKIINEDKHKLKRMGKRKFFSW